jgi:hypothetical protein
VKVCCENYAKNKHMYTKSKTEAVIKIVFAAKDTGIDRCFTNSIAIKINKPRINGGKKKPMPGPQEYAP